MKKIIIFANLMLLMIVSIMFNVTSVHAALIKYDISFEITDYTTIQGETSYMIGDVGEKLYTKLDSFFNLEVGTSMDIVIKKGTTIYSSTISHQYHRSSTLNPESHSYNIRIKDNGLDYSIRAFEVAPYEVANPTYPNPNYSLDTNQVQLGIFNFSPNAYHTILGVHVIEAMFETEIDPEEGIPTPDITVVPNTTGNLSNAQDSSKVGYVYFEEDITGLFDTYIILNGTQYNIGKLELPGVEELDKKPLNPGIYWTENGNQYIYYEFQQPTSVKPLNEQVTLFLDDPNNLTGFRPFVQMNLTDNTYAFTDKLTLYAGFHNGGEGRAYADVLFPMNLDDLLSIDIIYSQRWIGLWGLTKTGWSDKRVARYKDEVVHMNTTWNYITNYIIRGTYGIWQSINTGWNSTIQEITPITNDYSIAYTDKINKVRQDEGKLALTRNEIFNAESSLYRIYLDTYYDSRYTGYEIANDIAVVDALYQYKGEVYHVAYDDINTEGSFGGGGGFNPLDPGESLSPISIGVIATIIVIFLGLAQGNLITKKGLNTSYLITSVILGFITYLIVANWSTIISLAVTVLRL